MKAKGYTIRELAKLAKVPRSTLGDWLSGTTPTDFFAVKRVAIELGVSLSFLLIGEADHEIPQTDLTELGTEIVFDGIAELRLVRIRSLAKTP